MGITKKETKPTIYAIHVKNHLDSRWEHWFEGMAITQLDDGITVLSGTVVDQSALYGLLEKIHNLNLTLISIQPVDSESYK